jgi:hypothetical protein
MSKVVSMLSSNDTQLREIPSYPLIGDAEENFYQLGLKDRGQFLPTFGHISTLMETGFTPLDKTLSKGLELYGKRILSSLPSPYGQWMKAYAEGLNLKPEEYLRGLLKPELLSCLGKFIPNAPSLLFGCSSLIARTSQGETLHGRVLDFPLLGSFDQGEQFLSYQFKDSMKVFTHTSAGIPFTSLTSHNEKGMSLALHQKFNTSFHYDGLPIFIITDHLMRHCSNAKDFLRELKDLKTMTKWCLIASFSSGEVVVADKNGDEVTLLEKTLEERDLIHQNNLPLDNHLASIPQGMRTYCAQRERAVEEKLKKEKKIESTLDVLKVLAKPLGPKNPHLLDSITPSSLTIGVFNNSASTYQFIPTQAPKVFQNLSAEVTSLFSEPQIKEKKHRYTLDFNYAEGLRHYMQAQVAFDCQKSHESLHHIQMACEKLKGHDLEVLAKFYNLIFQYLDAKRKTEFDYLWEDFHSLHSELPAPWKDQAKLFIMRCQKICKGTLAFDKIDIENEYLRKVFEFESKLKPGVIKILRKLILPRIDIADVLYLYVKD